MRFRFEFILIKLQRGKSPPRSRPFHSTNVKLSFSARSVHALVRYPLSRAQADSRTRKLDLKLDRPAVLKGAVIEL